MIPSRYHSIDYGYALTVHKSQGMTAKNVSVLIDSNYWDRNLSFIAMTRHKDKLNIYTDKNNHRKINELIKSLLKHSYKLSAIDWAQSNYNSHDYDNKISLKRHFKKISEHTLETGCLGK